MATEVREAEREQEVPPGLSEDLIREVEQALEENETDRARELVEDLHVADQADLLEQLPPEERDHLVEILEPEREPDILTYLNEHVRAQVLEKLGPEKASQAVAGLETDDAVDVLSYLGEEDQLALLGAMPASERAMLEEGLSFPEESAGRLMQREMVAIPEFWTVGQTIDYLRAKVELPEEFYDLYIINPRFEPVGSIPLSRILRSRRNVLLHELKLKELHLIPYDLDQEDVAFRFRQYGLVSAPVVDQRGRLIGVITVDDVVDVLQEEAEEDILALGGARDSDIFAPPLRTSARRVPWLLVNLATATLAALVIAQFEAAIGELVVLAVLMPIVASLGGNAGIQALTVSVRALATKQITRANTLRILGKELVVGGLNGTVLLLAGIVLVVGWFGAFDLALVFGAGIILNIVVAALVGVTVPIFLDRMGLDPAVSSSVFVTTVTDVVGFFSFLGLAAIFLL